MWKGPKLLMQLPNSSIGKQDKNRFENINNMPAEYFDETFQFQKVSIFS